MNKGRIEEIGPAEAIYHSPQRPSAAYRRHSQSQARKHQAQTSHVYG